MRILTYFLLLLVLLVLGLFLWTRFQAMEIEKLYPPVGRFAPLGGGKLHYLDIAAPEGEEDKPPLLFIHGASGNLLDQSGAYQSALKGDARMIFIDRPGHGYSERAGADDPAKQADVYRQLLDYLKIDKAVLVGHSLGSASAAAFAVLYPERVKGLVFVAPATHPWPGGVTWYYDVATMPLIGRLFTEILTLPVGSLSVEQGVQSVFSPNKVAKNYIASSATPLVFRPHVFRHNSHDVATLKAFVTDFSPRYKEIKAPTVIVTGDKDDIVLAEIHSVGLERDIAEAELVVVEGVGHKPDYAATDQIVAAIRKVWQ